MAYLLDTHIVLWALDEEFRLSNSAREVISNLDSECYTSVISFFEMAIKKKTGKLELAKTITEYIVETQRIGIKLLSITPSHLDDYQTLPLHSDHRDPFDRIIIATACTENLIIITADEKFRKYSELVDILW